MVELPPPLPPSNLVRYGGEDLRQKVENAFLRILTRLESDESRGTYRARWKGHLEFLHANGIFPIATEVAHVARWLEDMRARGLATKTRRNCLAIARLVYKELVVEGVIPLNPTRELSVRRHQGEKGRAPRVTMEEVQKVLASHDLTTWLGRRNQLIVLYAIGTGLRKSSIVAVHVEDVREKGESGKPALFVRKAKGGKQAELPMPAMLFDATKAWITHAGLQPTSPLFPKSFRDGTVAIKKATIGRLLKEAAARAGVAAPQATPHAFRRAFARQLRLRGHQMEDIRLLLMHSSIEETRLYVGDVMPDAAGGDAILAEALHPVKKEGE